MIKTPQSPVIGGNAKMVRRINRYTILNIIREKQPISRAAITELTGLNKGTVSKIVGELLEKNYVHEQPLHDGNIGRNRLQLTLKSGKHRVGAIDIGPLDTIVGIADVTGQLLQTASFPSEILLPEVLVEQSFSHLNQLKNDAGINRLDGIGVSIPGIVDSISGNVIVSPNLGWRNLDFRKIIAPHLADDDVAVYDNDANVGAMAELWFDKRVKDLDDFVFISQGVGTGIVMGGKLIRGGSGLAGEFGHIPVVEEGERCACGNLGCWEVYASYRSAIRRYTQQLNPADAAAGNSHPITFEHIVQRANAGEENATAALKETGKYLGLGISNIIKAIDPRAVVIDGKITRAWEIIFPEMMREIKRRIFYGISKEIEIYPTAFETRASLIGAATLAIRQIFSGPVIMG